MPVLRPLHALNALLVAGLFAFALLSYDALPERFLVHFDLRGQPDGWATRSLWSALALPFVALGTAAVTYACARLIARRPDLVNVPGKRPFQQLPPEVQQQVTATLQAYLYAMTTAALVLFATLTVGTFEAAQTGTLPPYVMVVVLAFLVSSVLSVPVLLYRLSVQS